MRMIGNGVSSGSDEAATGGGGTGAGGATGRAVGGGVVVDVGKGYCWPPAPAGAIAQASSAPKQAITSAVAERLGPPPRLLLVPCPMRAQRLYAANTSVHGRRARRPISGPERARQDSNL